MVGLSFNEWRQRAAANRIAAALCFSLVFHLAVWGGLQVRKSMGWDRRPTPAWLKMFQFTQPLAKALAKPAEIKKTPVPDKPEVPLMFVEVDPTQVAPAPPKDAKFYSSANSVAANPDTRLDTDKPKIEGKQEKIIKTIDVLRPQPQPLQPAQSTTKETQAQPEIKEAQPQPKASPKLGDLAMAKPFETLRPSLGKADTKTGDAAEKTLPKPRTLAEAKARLQNSSLVGEKMKMDGGVKNLRLESSSLDVQATPFGAYDAKVIHAIQQRWYDLLGDRASPDGKVVLEFRMHPDGRVSEMRVIEHEVGELYSLFCQRAVLDPAKYEPWPSDMRRLIGADFREVRFTFYYN